MSKILVTGGCGYIGSHAIVDLVQHGYEVVSADSLIRSSIKQLDGVTEILGCPIKNYLVDLCDKEATRRIFEAEKDITGVIHFAALKSVGESVFEPTLYYTNNLTSLVNVLECCAEFGVKQFIFSSSCSVYGNTTELPVTENTPLQKTESPYAHTKQIGEGIIEHFAKRYTDIRFILLRYFNPAGAHPSGLIGESPLVEATNLVPVVIETALGKRPQLSVFGTDYATRDGSCIRDYIHIMDLAAAHTKSLDYLIVEKNETNCEVFNVGIGQGVTVLEAINAFEKISNLKLNVFKTDRRLGDIEAIYADYSLAKKHLGWTPQYSIEDIMQTAWKRANR
ncbi:MAG: UDP-glucose 4-epimerase GalE [Bacteroidota bacterium]